MFVYGYMLCYREKLLIMCFKANFMPNNHMRIIEVYAHYIPM